MAPVGRKLSAQRRRRYAEHGQLLDGFLQQRTDDERRAVVDGLSICLLYPEFRDVVDVDVRSLGHVGRDEVRCQEPVPDCGGGLPLRPGQRQQQCHLAGEGLRRRQAGDDLGDQHPVRRMIRVSSCQERNARRIAAGVVRRVQAISPSASQPVITGSSPGVASPATDLTPQVR